jgi:hypothetical protein
VEVEGEQIGRVRSSAQIEGGREAAVAVAQENSERSLFVVSDVGNAIPVGPCDRALSLFAALIEHALSIRLHVAGLGARVGPITVDAQLSSAGAGLLIRTHRNIGGTKGEGLAGGRVLGAAFRFRCLCAWRTPQFLASYGYSSFGFGD